MFATAPATTSTENRALRSSDRSTSGHCTRCSTTTNNASAVSAPANATIVGADTHPHCGARSNVKVNKPIPAVMSASPMMSMRRGAVSSEDSSMLQAPSASDTTVSGTLSQKIQRQPTVSVSRPPISGPAALPNPAMP
jgi:hypothetical protein